MEKRQMCGDGKMPYFLTNPKWYYRDKYGGLRLAKDAPPEARKSYEEFFKDPEPDENGRITEY